MRITKGALIGRAEEWGAPPLSPHQPHSIARPIRARFVIRIFLPATPTEIHYYVLPGYVEARPQKWQLTLHEACSAHWGIP